MAAVSVLYTIVASIAWHPKLDSWKQIDVRWVLLKASSSLWRIYLLLILAALLGQRHMMYPAPRPAVVPKNARLSFVQRPARRFKPKP